MRTVSLDAVGHARNVDIVANNARTRNLSAHPERHVATLVARLVRLVPLLATDDSVAMAAVQVIMDSRYLNNTLSCGALANEVVDLLGGWPSLPPTVAQHWLERYGIGFGSDFDNHNSG